MNCAITSRSLVLSYLKFVIWILSLEKTSRQDIVLSSLELSRDKIRQSWCNANVEYSILSRQVSSFCFVSKVKETRQTTSFASHAQVFCSRKHSCMLCFKKFLHQLGLELTTQGRWHHDWTSCRPGKLVESFKVGIRSSLPWCYEVGEGRERNGHYNTAW